jgi:hypothetical protein
LKKAVIILSVLLLLTSLALAGEKCADEKGKAACSDKCKLTKGSAECTAKHEADKAVSDKKDDAPKAKVGCAETCKLAKGATGCAAMKTEVKAASGEAKPAECTMHAQAAKAEAEAKPAECPMHAQTVKAEGAVKTEETASSASGEMVKAEGETKAPAPTCGDKVQSMELKQFHAAMHPMALAMGFEGDEKPDMAKFRTLYPAMKEKTEALAKMPVDEKTAKDTKAFTEKRAELVKLVDELGVACKGTDDSKINHAFEKVHEGYIQLVSLTK